MLERNWQVLLPGPVSWSLAEGEKNNDLSYHRGEMPDESLPPASPAPSSGMTKNDTICIVLIGVLASAAAGLLINAYVSNIDLLSYISLSQRYLHGSLRDAVNAYWSPLFSWLLLPFLLLPVEPVIAAKF